MKGKKVFWLTLIGFTILVVLATKANAADKIVVPSMEQDGYVRKGSADWITARDASTGDAFQNTTTYSFIAVHLFSGDYRLYRTFLIFNLTSQLGEFNESMNITSARLDTRSKGGTDTIDNFFILEGTQGLWLLNDYSNYNDLNPAPSGSDGSGADELYNSFCKQAYDNTEGAWLNCTFNNTGRTFVQDSLEADGLVTLALISEGDYLDQSSYASSTYLGRIYNYEGGADYWPRLIINYTITTPKVWYTSNTTNFTSTTHNKHHVFNITPLSNVTWGGQYIFNYTASNGESGSRLGTWSNNTPITETLLTNYSGGGWFAWQWWFNTTNIEKTNITGIFNITYGAIDLSIYDERTGGLLENTNISLWVISSNYSQNYTYDVPNFSVGFLPINEEIEIRVWGNKNGKEQTYKKRNYYTTIIEQRIINFYLLNSSIGSHFIFKLFSPAGAYLTNYTLQAARYFIANNSYKIVDMGKTSQVGETVLFLEPNVEPYKFYVKNPSGNLVYTSQPWKLVNQEYIIYVDETEDYLDSFVTILGADTSLTYDRTGGYFKYTWSDTNNQYRNVMLNVTRMTGYKSYLYCSNESTAVTGTLTCTIQSGDEGDYIAQSWIDTDSAYSMGQTGFLSWAYDMSRFERWGKRGPFYSFFIIAGLAVLGLPHPVTAILLPMLGVIGTYAAGMMNWGLSVIMGLLVIGLWIIIKSNKRKEA